MFYFIILLSIPLIISQTTTDEDFVKKYQPRYIKEGDNKTFPRFKSIVFLDTKLYNTTYGLLNDFNFRGGYNQTEKHKLNHVSKNMGYNLIHNYPACFENLIYRMSKGEIIDITCSGPDSYPEGYKFTYFPFFESQDIILRVHLKEVYGKSRESKYQRMDLEKNEAKIKEDL